MAKELNLDDLFTKMLEATKKSLQSNLKSRWPKVRDLTAASIRDLAQNMVDIRSLLASGAITREQASLKFSMQRNAFRTLLLTEKGISLIVAEEAVNSALKAVKDTVNKLVGFALV
jgi:hypothetical protein